MGCIFFLSRKRRHTRCALVDWSSDVCSSDLQVELTDEEGANQAEAASRNAQRVENEAKIYRSRAVAETVVRDLELTSNSRFMGSAARPEGRVREQDRALATTRLVNAVSILNNEDRKSTRLNSRH